MHITSQLKKKRKIGVISSIPVFATPSFILLFFILVCYFIVSPPLTQEYIVTITSVFHVPIFDFKSTPFIQQVFVVVLTLIMVYGSLLLHEIAHAIAAEKYSNGVDNITLWILGGVAKLSNAPNHPRSEFIITIVGPLTSAVLAAVCIIAAYIATVVQITMLATILFVVGVINALMVAVNMVPAFPLDGGRVLRSLLTSVVGTYYTATTITTYTAQCIAVGICIYGGITNDFILILAGIFIFVFAVTEQHNTMVKTTIFDYPSFNDPHTKKPALSFGNIVLIPDDSFTSTEQSNIVESITAAGGNADTATEILQTKTPLKPTKYKEISIAPKLNISLPSNAQDSGITPLYETNDGDLIVLITKSQNSLGIETGTISLRSLQDLLSKLECNTASCYSAS